MFYFLRGSFVYKGLMVLNRWYEASLFYHLLHRIYGWFLKGWQSSGLRYLSQGSTLKQAQKHSGLERLWLRVTRLVEKLLLWFTEKLTPAVMKSVIIQWCLFVGRMVRQGNRQFFRHLAFWFAVATLFLQGVLFLGHHLMPLPWLPYYLSLPKLGIALLLSGVLALVVIWFKPLQNAWVRSGLLHQWAEFWLVADEDRRWLQVDEKLSHQGKRQTMVLAILLTILFFTLPLKQFVILLMVIPLVGLLWRQPIYGLYGTAFLIPFLPFRFLAILVVLNYGLLMIKRLCQHEPLWEGTRFSRSLGFMLLVTLAGVVGSISFWQSLGEWIIFLVAIFLGYLVVYFVHDRKGMERLALVILISATIVAGIGLVQYFTLGETNTGWVDQQLNPGISTRVYSTLENPNHLAEYLVMAILISFIPLFTTRNPLAFLFSLGGIGLMVLTMFVTFSRGGYVALAAALFLFILFTMRRMLLVLAPFLVVGLYLLPATIWERLLTIGNVQDSSISYRFSIWQSAQDMFQDFFWFGAGYGYDTFITLFPLYRAWPPIAFHAHNLYLEIALELGMVGLIAFAFFFLRLFGVGLSTIQRNRENRFNTIVLGASLAGIAGLLIHGMAEYVWFYPKVILMFWLVVGIVLAVTRTEKRVEKVME
ncbi:O-antigen ligase family protein [Rubeoparvulum massiliense]|uniref:O-antigen ligase family protein n=1 Tax=Rubeoparvulum massiliense TaxID=1631346 RepID=UPI00065E82F6|nr:O-antigen ligase family protein [Rubeoparvulum massiliense]